MKKIIISVIITMIVVCPATIIVMNLLNKENNVVEKETKKELTLGIISEEKIENYELPTNINILVSGLYSNHIGEEFLKDLDIYKIKVVIQGNTSLVEKEYVGIKMTDIEAKLGITDYQAISIRHGKSIKKNISKNEINEHCYLIFEENGEKYINNVKVNIINLDEIEGYHLNGVSELYYYNPEDISE